MNNKNGRPEEDAEMRRRAEEEHTVQEKAAPLPKNLDALSSEELRRALHEMRVQQIELETQNGELQREHIFMHALLENIPDHIYFKDTASRFLRVNPPMARLFGLSAPVEAVGKTDADFFSTEHANQAYTDEQEILRTGRPLKNTEEKETWPDGSESWVVTTKLPLRDHEGRIMGTCGISRDITERKRAEEALRDREERLSCLSELQGFLLIPNSIEHKFKLITQAVVRIIGADFARIWMIKPGDRCQAGCIHAQIVEGPHTCRYRDLCLHLMASSGRYSHTDGRDHSRVPFGAYKIGRIAAKEESKLLTNEVTNDPRVHNHTWAKELGLVSFAGYRLVDMTGNPLGVLALFSKQEILAKEDLLLQGIADATSHLLLTVRVEAEREKLEALNRQLQKSESLGRMAGAIAHHFNNQLHVVLGSLEMALAELPRTAEEPVEFLRNAMGAARRASEVSSLMLTYLGQTPANLTPLDLSETCRRGLPILRAVMPKDAVLESDLPYFGPRVSGNVNQIQQLLTNLITNAWEAANDKPGVIRLSVKTVLPSDISTLHRHPSKSEIRDSAYACLEVADNGCGISEENIEKLFDPFFSSKFTGRGMGLAVVLGIVRTHGGAITVESKPGHGSIFRVYLPLTTEAILPQPEKMIVVSEIPEGGTVLLVEDEEMIRKMAATMLKRLGFMVLEAKDGVEALEVFRQHPDEIRCVLCDLTMPRMDGWETLRALRQIAPGIPVILASGHSEAQVLDGDRPERPQAFLSKPYRREELRQAIHRALAGNFISLTLNPEP